MHSISGLACNLMILSLPNTMTGELHADFRNDMGLQIATRGAGPLVRCACNPTSTRDSLGAVDLAGASTDARSQSVSPVVRRQGHEISFISMPGTKSIVSRVDCHVNAPCIGGDAEREPWVGH